jgi:hypothetical protein
MRMNRCHITSALVIVFAGFIWVELITSGVEPAFQTSRCKLPRGFGWKPLANGRTVIACTEPAYLNYRHIFMANNGDIFPAAKAFNAGIAIVPIKDWFPGWRSASVLIQKI